MADQAESATRPFASVVVVAPWYPSPEAPMNGAFVRDAVEAMSLHHEERITVVHVDTRPVDDDAPVAEQPSWWRTDPEADVLCIREPMDAMVPRGEMMDAHRRLLRKHALDVLREARVVSCHVGGPTGAAVAPLLRGSTRMTITEHATYVGGIFADPHAAEQYRAGVARSSVVIGVSDVAANRIRKYCPEQTERIISLPNPVRFAHLPMRTEPVRAMNKWLYVGNFIERKQVVRLLRAFAQEYAETGNNELHLTLIGDGPQREELENLSVELGVADRLSMPGSVDPTEVGPIMADQDVLVHLSDYETFGLTVIEAIATGLPVVVTRCGGPEETMVIPEHHGMTRYVPVEPSLRAVRDAVAGLRLDMTMSEVRAVRDAMETVYGFDRVADLLCRHVLGEHPNPPLTHRRPLRLTVVAQTPNAWRLSKLDVRQALAFGAEVTVADQSGQVTQAPPGAMLVPSTVSDYNNVVSRTERMLIETIPGMLLTLLRKVVEPLPKVGKGLGWRIGRVQRFHRRASQWVHRKGSGRFWSIFGGRAAARSLVANPQLRNRPTDVLVSTAGPHTQYAYRVMQEHPDLTYYQGRFGSKQLGIWWTSLVPADQRSHPDETSTS